MARRSGRVLAISFQDLWSGRIGQTSRTEEGVVIFLFFSQPGAGKPFFSMHFVDRCT